MTQAPGRPEERTIERLREHFKIEKELAGRLREAPRQERRALYTSLYNELFQRVPDHPQLTRKASAERTRGIVAAQMKPLRRFLNETKTFLEVGPGDCSLAVQVARRVRRVIAVDVSHEITKDLAAPENLELVLSDGCSIPVPHGSVDVAYSHQLMEHLHPEDATEQLRNIFDALAPGGVYICITPNRLTGPHDISRYFESVACGFHLKEYTNAELSRAFRSVGFGGLRALIERGGDWVLVPPLGIILLEWFLLGMPYEVRKSIAARPQVRRLLGIQLVGRKKLNRGHHLGSSERLA